MQSISCPRADRQPSDTTGVVSKQPTSQSSAFTAAEAFAHEVAAKVGDRPCTIAVFPIVGADGQVTLASESLADEVMGALTGRSYRIVDRQSLKTVISEKRLKELATAPDESTDSGPIPGADVIVIGRYALIAGRITLQLKAVDVQKSEFLLFRSYYAATDKRIRQLIPPPEEPGIGLDRARIEETDRAVRIRASYVEEGADSLHLLDRVRQRIRRALTWYLIDAAGLPLDAEGVDEHFRRGRETDCRFDSGSVTLEMEFGVAP